MAAPRTNLIRSPVKRGRANTYMLIMLISFAISVVGTRLYLELTGYPQVGNGTLHIAHVLWGGLALFIGAMLPLIWINSWVYNISAVLTGVGVGLFIDEIGKFITQTNDYFFPFAAPLIYGFFLIAVLLYLQLRRHDYNDPRTLLYHALELMMEVVDHDLEPSEQADLELTLKRLQASDDAEAAALAHALSSFLYSGSVSKVPERLSPIDRLSAWALAMEDRFLRRRIIRLILTGMLIALGIFTLLNFLFNILLLLDPDLTETVFLTWIEYVPNITGTTSANWYLAQIAIGGALGMVMLIAGILMLVGQIPAGIRVAIPAFAIELCIASILQFYFNQFAAVGSALLYLVLLLLALRYQQRFLIKRETTPPQNLAPAS
jgi:hypothetical protein